MYVCEEERDRERGQGILFLLLVVVHPGCFFLFFFSSFLLSFLSSKRGAIRDTLKGKRR